MKNSFLLITALLLSSPLYGENNQTQESNTTTELNSTVESNSTLPSKENNQTKLVEQHLQEQMEREKVYAEQQSFAQGDDYDLKAVEINPASLDNIPAIEPDYDFDMTDVYRDDL